MKIDNADIIPRRMEHNHNRGGRHLWLGPVVGLICLAAVFLFYARPSEIIENLRTVRYGYLILTAAGIVLFMVLRAVRWRFLLGNAAPYMQVFHIQNIGYMLTQLLPLRLGDVARAILIGNVPPITIAQGVSTMVVERVLDMLFIVVLLPFSVAEVESLPEWMQSVARGSGFAAVLAIVALIVAANQRRRAVDLADRLMQKLLPFLNRETWLRRLDRLLVGLSSLTNVRDGLILVGLSVLVWLPILGAYYATMLAVNLTPTWTMTAFVVCAAAFSVAVPSTPGQIGPFHFAVTTALQLSGRPAAEAAGFAFVYHLLNLLVLTVLGVIGILRTGVTFRHVVDSAQSFAARQKAGSPERPG